MQQKMQAVRRGVEAWHRGGRDASSIGTLMEQVPPLLRHGKQAEAEAVLDRALRLLQNPD